MKTLLTICCSLYLGILWSESKTEKVVFYYVLENPKFYGLDSAHSWFEIQGLKDKTVENKINDTLRKIFFATTNFAVQKNGPDGVGQGPTPPFHTDYTFYNGNTYGIGWVRFKDSDSLLYLQEADGYHGGGMHLSGFSTWIAQGKIAWIQIESIGITNAPTQIAFSLVTGNILPTSFKVALDPLKKDSLTNILDRIASTGPDQDVTNIHDCKVKTANPMEDSVTIGVTVLISWFRGDMSPNQHLIERKYVRGCLNKGDQPMNRDFVSFLTFNESIPFLKKEDWLALQAVYLQ